MAHAGRLAAKTPNDVYIQMMLLKQQVVVLRAHEKIKNSWPKVRASQGIASRHVLQKSLEVLDKIRRLRGIRDMGDIAVPAFPSRNITPNEVFDMVTRLVSELSLFPELQKQKQKIVGKKPGDVYRELWGISLALDPVLGVRGLKPADVFAQSQMVLEQIRFLRTTQNQSGKILEPKRTDGKHPNHSLQEAYILLGKIAKAEANLWIDPVQVPKVPQRVIESGEVYDALQIVRAELERIKFRLGVERIFIVPEVKGLKTPDDVIVNLKMAVALMPDFDPVDRLSQYPQASLNKTPNHVYRVTEHILDELGRYRELRGIKMSPRKVPRQVNLQPYHVYQKTLECTNKVNQLRGQVGLGSIALPKHHLRSITPAEVYELATRLDSELGILYDQIDMPNEIHGLDARKLYTNKTLSDAFQNIWAIYYLMDTMLGSHGNAPSDVYNQARKLVAELTLINEHLNKARKFKLPSLKAGKHPSDVLNLADKLMEILKQIKFRAGILERALPIPSKPEEAIPDDVYNQIGIILSELVNIKVHLGISKYTEEYPEAKGKTPSHVFQQLSLARVTMLELVK